MRYFVFLLLSLLTTPAFVQVAQATDTDFDETVVNCRQEPGRTLCRDMRRFDSVLQPCAGQTCYRLWEAQLRTIDNSLDHYYEEVEYESSMGRDIGGLARDTSSRLCRANVVGPPHLVNQMVVAYNRYLKMLKEIQELAGQLLIESCQFNPV